MADTRIQWTNTVWNPTTGCDRISPGCDNCYALRMAARLKAMGQARYQHDGDPRTSGPGFGLTCHPDALDAPTHWRKPRRVFVNSMSDLFHKDVPEEFVLAVWAAMEAAPQHTYQILTKRPQRMAQLLGRGSAPRPSRPEPAAAELPIVGYAGYSVDVSGTVWSERRKGIRKRLSPDTGEQGHQRVTLYTTEGERRRELVHHLVLTAFDRGRVGDEQGRHLNGDATDNRLDNLCWGSQEDNWADKIDHGHEQAWAALTWTDVLAIRTGALRGVSAASIGRIFGVSDTQVRNIVAGRQWAPRPRPWIWLGTSIENDRYAFRANYLRETTAAVRFLSCEPLLGPLPSLDLTGIDWVIVGGESGPGARVMELDWAHEIVERCQLYGVPAFVKQLGIAHGRDHHDIERFPVELRVREYPA